MKKGQITIAIIVGIVLLLASSLIVYLTQVPVMPVEDRILLKAPEQAKPVVKLVQECVKGVALPGIFLVGVQGGYFIPPANALNTAYSDIGYGYDRGENTLASIEDMEAQLSLYMDSAVPACSNFSIFAGRGMNISAGAIKTETVIAEAETFFKIKWSLTITIGDTTTTVEEFAERDWLRVAG